MGRCRTFILWLFRPALRPLKLPSQIGVPGRGRTCGLSIISRTLYQLSYENIYVEADNRLLLSWRHGVFPAPVGFHHYILLASMAQQRGLEPLSRSDAPATRFPGGPTANYRTAADCPAELFSHYFITADRTGSRDTREHVTDALMATGVGLEPTDHISGRRFSGPSGYHYRTLPCGEEGGT